MTKKADSLVQEYEKFINNEVKTYETPGKPNEYLKKDDDIMPVDIDKYRSFVGQIMFLSTKLCPKIGAAKRALSGFMSCPNEDHWKALDRVIGYIKGMKVKGILYKEPESFKVISLCDTDYGNCHETRRSVGCCLFTIGCMLVGWHMSKHLTLSDSSCEAGVDQVCKRFEIYSNDVK